MTSQPLVVLRRVLSTIPGLVIMSTVVFLIIWCRATPCAPCRASGPPTRTWPGGAIGWAVPCFAAATQIPLIEEGRVSRYAWRLADNIIDATPLLVMLGAPRPRLSRRGHRVGSSPCGGPVLHPPAAAAPADHGNRPRRPTRAATQEWPGCSRHCQQWQARAVRGGADTSKRAAPHKREPFTPLCGGASGQIALDPPDVGLDRRRRRRCWARPSSWQISQRASVLSFAGEGSIAIVRGAPAERLNSGAPDPLFAGPSDVATPDAGAMFTPLNPLPSRCAIAPLRRSAGVVRRPPLRPGCRGPCGLRQATWMAGASIDVRMSFWSQAHRRPDRPKWRRSLHRIPGAGSPGNPNEAPHFQRRESLAKNR